jgi:hypothetical protein
LEEGGPRRRKNIRNIPPAYAAAAAGAAGVASYGATGDRAAAAAAGFSSQAKRSSSSSRTKGSSGRWSSWYDYNNIDEDDGDDAWGINDVEDLDVLFAAAPRQLRGARRSSTRPASAARTAAAAAADISDDVVRDEQDEQQQKQQQGVVDAGSHQSTWAHLFDALLANDCSRAVEQQQQQQQQQQVKQQQVGCDGQAQQEQLQQDAACVVEEAGGCSSDPATAGVTGSQEGTSCKQQQHACVTQGIAVSHRTTLSGAAAGGEAFAQEAAAPAAMAATTAVMVAAGAAAAPAVPSEMQLLQQLQLTRLQAVHVPAHCGTDTAHGRACHHRADGQAAAATAAGAAETAAAEPAKSQSHQPAAAAALIWCYEVLELHMQQQQQTVQPCNADGATPDVAGAAAAAAAAADVAGAAATAAAAAEAAEGTDTQQQQQHPADAVLLLPRESHVRSAYRRLAVLLHPDKCSLKGAAAAFALVRRAHTALMQALAAQRAAAAASLQQELAASRNAAAAGQLGDEGNDPTQSETAGEASSDVQTAGNAAHAAAPSNRNRRTAVGLQLTPQLLQLLQLPAGFLQPAVAGDSQLPLLLLVNVKPGEVCYRSFSSFLDLLTCLLHGRCLIVNAAGHFYVQPGEAFRWCILWLR